MTILRHVILATHFIGLAAILTGWVVWRRTQVVEMLSVWGARIQILTGLALVGIAEALATEARPVNHANGRGQARDRARRGRRLRDRQRPGPQAAGGRRRFARHRRGRVDRGQRPRGHALVSLPRPS